MEDCRGRRLCPCLCPCLDFFHSGLDFRAVSREQTGVAAVEMEEQSLLDAAGVFPWAILCLREERFSRAELVELSFRAELFFRQAFLFLAKCYLAFLLAFPGFGLASGLAVPERCAAFHWARVRQPGVSLFRGRKQMFSGQLRELKQR